MVAAFKKAGIGMRERFSQPQMDNGNQEGENLTARRLRPELVKDQFVLCKDWALESMQTNKYQNLINILAFKKQEYLWTCYKVKDTVSPSKIPHMMS